MTHTCPHCKHELETIMPSYAEFEAWFEGQITVDQDDEPGAYAAYEWLRSRLSIKPAKIVSESELDRIVDEWFLDSLNGMDLTHNRAYFKAGFRKACQMNARMK